LRANAYVKAVNEGPPFGFSGNPHTKGADPYVFPPYGKTEGPLWKDVPFRLAELSSRIHKGECLTCGAQDDFPVLGQRGTSLGVVTHSPMTTRFPSESSFRPE
jgi:hypothetical protein